MMARLYRLTEIHQKIDEHLRLEQRKRAPDSLEMTRLKRLKLRIKDRIQWMLARRAATA
ncbi:DUF465 domain-containing protein [Altererythrobacter sp. MF3-039]|uniref:DUF465 domain-containing protein n=1 Tax=Altererythrobacter sp. MF3-039 TaxID=3252901 RepID=UPI00390CB100